jgi:hypothetical protein
MPFTPYHLGPALCFGLPLRKYLHAPTFILGNIVVDIEPFVVLFLGLRYPLHGYLHTFISAFCLGLVLGFGMYFLERIVHPLYKAFRLEPKITLNMKPFIVAGVLGTMLHVVLDSPLYADMMPFYPITTNPLYDSLSSLQVYSLCVWMGILGIVFYVCLLFHDMLWKKSHRDLS